MNEHDEPCLELNEIIYRISGEFWNAAYCELLRKQGDIQPDTKMSPDAAVHVLKKGLKAFAKEHKFNLSFLTSDSHLYISIIPLPIYVGIEKATGNFSVAAPNIHTKSFSALECRLGLKWIRDYIDIDLNTLTKKIDMIRERMYVSTKTAEIAKNSIKALCDSFLGQVLVPYEINQSRLKSNIIIHISRSKCVEIQIYHKAFIQNSTLLTNFLKNPYEQAKEDGAYCWEEICK